MPLFSISLISLHFLAFLITSLLSIIGSYSSLKNAKNLVLYDYTQEEIREEKTLIVKRLVIIVIVSIFTVFSILLRGLTGPEIEFIDNIINIFTIPIIYLFVYYFIKIFFKYFPQNKKRDNVSYFEKYITYIFSYSSAFTIISIIIIILNTFISISKTEEITTEVRHKSHYKVTGKHASEDYIIQINPPIYYYNKIRVSEKFYNEAQYGYRIKAYVKRGIFGAKYFILDKHIIKPSIKETILEK